MIWISARFYSPLIATEAKAPSVLQLRTEDIRPKTVGKQVLAALQQAEENINQGALVTIDPSKNRIRLLPLKQNNR